jgi:hypothetical protein
MSQIVGIWILFVFLFPLYFVYKDFKRQWFVPLDAVEEYCKALLFGMFVTMILSSIGFGLFLIFGG